MNSIFNFPFNISFPIIDFYFAHMPAVRHKQGALEISNIKQLISTNTLFILAQHKDAIVLLLKLKSFVNEWMSLTFLP